MPVAAPFRVDLGCGPRKPPGYFGIDRHPWQEVDQVADLTLGIPLEDDSVDEIRAVDCLEHLPDKIYSLNEIWRVLRPGGTAEIVVPSTSGPGAWMDPTHVSYWNALSFWYVQDGNPHRETLGEAYGIKARFKIEELGEITDDRYGIIHVRALLRAIKE